MSYNSATDLVRKLAPKPYAEASKDLVRFFAATRFGLKGEDFSAHFTDGTDDGGIDLFAREGDAFYIVQSKFASESHAASEDEIWTEVTKILNSLTASNPNSRAEEFVNAFRRSAELPATLLEIIWLTTNRVRESIADEVEKQLADKRKQFGWKCGCDFVSFDFAALERLIADMAHGYVPYTGKRELPLSGRKFIEKHGDGHGIYSILCNVRLTDMVKWIREKAELNHYLQKNIREYVGENKINKAIQQSFLESPDWFWYKHNGIIVFADSVAVSPDEERLVMRNPQIVNGGQTLTAVYKAFDRSGRRDSTAEVLVRAYRMPYERAETYDESIEIVKALNSQNPIKPSDLHSTDPRQVRLQRLFEDFGYTYWRKRSKEAKSSRQSITMRKLALYYFVCRRQAPHEGVIGQIEEIFAERGRYDDAFPEEAINRELNSSNHVVLSYVLVWRLSEIASAVKKELAKRDRDVSGYTFYYVLSDLFDKVQSWKSRSFNLPGWRNWRDFVESPHFENGVWQYAKKSYRTASDVVHGEQEPRKHLKRKEAAKSFASRAPKQTILHKRLTTELAAFERAQETGT